MKIINHLSLHKIKKEYIIQSKISEVACLCPEWKNIGLMLDQVNLPLKSHDLIGKVVCNPIIELCAEGNCENCPEIDLEPLAD